MWGGTQNQRVLETPPKLTQVSRSLGVDAQVLHSNLEPGGGGWVWGGSPNRISDGVGDKGHGLEGNLGAVVPQNFPLNRSSDGREGYLGDMAKVRGLEGVPQTECFWGERNKGHGQVGGIWGVHGIWNMGHGISMGYGIPTGYRIQDMGCLWDMECAMPMEYGVLAGYGTWSMGCSWYPG